MNIPMNIPYQYSPPLSAQAILEALKTHDPSTYNYVMQFAHDYFCALADWQARQYIGTEA